jgi:signal recognition particle subunit SRP54
MYQQFIALRKMGGFSKVLSMLGGQNLPKEAKEMAEGNLDRVQVIIQSCTQEEKDDPNMIKKTRITRIAKGSGTTYTEVKGLLKQWSAMNTMMKGMLGKKRRGKRGQQMPGMPGMDGELPKGMDLQQAQQMMAGAQKKKRKKHPW